MAFTKGFVKTAQGLGDMINANITKAMGNVGKAVPRPPTPPATTSVMGQAFGSIRKAFGGA